jgi:hypothetical protein
MTVQVDIGDGGERSLAIGGEGVVASSADVARLAKGTD